MTYLLEQMSLAGEVSAEKMFGEYAIYLDAKIVALVCDDQLYVKPTPGGKAFLGEFEEAAPYPSAKPHLLITGEKWNDREWLSELIRISARELSVVKKKPKR